MLFPLPSLLFICVAFIPITTLSENTYRKGFPRIFRTPIQKKDVSTTLTQAAEITMSTPAAVQTPPPKGDGYLSQMIGTPTNQPVLKANAMLGRIFAAANATAAGTASSRRVGEWYSRAAAAAKLTLPVNKSSVSAYLRRGRTPVSWLTRQAVSRRITSFRSAAASSWAAYDASNATIKRMMTARPMVRPLGSARRLVGTVKGLLSRSMRFAETVLENATREEAGGEDDEVHFTIDSSFNQSTDTTRILSTIIPFALSFVEMDSNKWQFLSEKNGIRVLRSSSPQLPSGGASKWPCFRASSVVNADVEDIASLLLDSTKVHMINRYPANHFNICYIIEPLSLFLYSV